MPNKKAKFYYLSGLISIFLFVWRARDHTHTHTPEMISKFLAANSIVFLGAVGLTGKRYKNKCMPQEIHKQPSQNHAMNLWFLSGTIGNET